MKRKVNDNGLDIKGDHFSQTRQFEIEKSAEAFDLVVKNIYSRPVEAVIRELACNSYDSHVAAGNEDEPFDVHIPNHYNQEFHIRDYGTGFIPEEINTLYTVVFKSDKTNTNSQTGCFGVGSKSPFAVVSKFMVESYQDGEKHVYSVFTDKGIPSITKMGSFDAPDERDGFKVAFQVPNKLIDKFQQKAAVALRPFDPPPNIKNTNISLEDDRDVIVEKDNWTLLETEEISYYETKHHSPKVIMGNVVYEIDKNEIPSAFDNVEIEVPLGTIMPAASREHIRYDNEETREYLNEVFEDIKEDVCAAYQEEINNQDDIWDAVIRYNKIKSEVNESKSLKNVISGYDFDYQGQELPDYHDVLWSDLIDTDNYTDDDFEDLHIYRFRQNSKSRRNVWQNPKRDEFAKNKRNSISILHNIGWSRNPNSRNRIEVIYVDKNYGKYAKGKYYAKKMDVDTCYYFDGPKEMYDELIKNLQEYFTDVEEKNVTDLPNRPKRDKVTGATDKGKADALVFKPSRYSNSNNREYWRLWDDELDDGKVFYYVEVNRYKWRTDPDGELIDPEQLSDKLKFLKKNFGLDINIVGVKTRILDDVDEFSWKPLQENIDKFLDFIGDSFDEDVFHYNCALRNVSKDGVHYETHMPGINWQRKSNMRYFFNKMMKNLRENFHDFPDDDGNFPYGSQRKMKKFFDKVNDPRLREVYEPLNSFYYNVASSEVREYFWDADEVKKQESNILESVANIFDDYAAFERIVQFAGHYHFLDMFDDRLADYFNKVYAYDGMLKDSTCSGFVGDANNDEEKEVCVVNKNIGLQQNSTIIEDDAEQINGRYQ